MRMLLCNGIAKRELFCSPIDIAVPCVRDGSQEAHVSLSLDEEDNLLQKASLFPATKASWLQVIPPSLKNPQRWVAASAHHISNPSGISHLHLHNQQIVLPTVQDGWG